MPLSHLFLKSSGLLLGNIFLEQPRKIEPNTCDFNLFRCFIGSRLHPALMGGVCVLITASYQSAPVHWGFGMLGQMSVILRSLPPELSQVRLTLAT